MIFTLTINPGSSSKKFALYKESRLLLDAYIERGKDGFEICTAVSGVQQKCELIDRSDFKESLQNFLDLAVESGYIESHSDISRVAVRVVVPGTFFQKHRVVDDNFLDKLKKIEVLALLHVPRVLNEFEAIRRFLPAAKIIAVSDSEFHKTIPDYIRNYSLPEDMMKRYDIYRFGYHGLSVASVMHKLPTILKKESNKTIICHIGNGVSVTALENGKSLDTTMGYGPGGGLVMGSRGGDLDTEALLALMQTQNMKPTDAQIYLQANGGLQGIAKESDLRVLLARRAKGDKMAEEAIASFVYQIQKAIGSYLAILGGIDTLVFTATAAERSSTLRSLIMKKLAPLGLKICEEKNEACLGRDGIISHDDSPVAVLVVTTNESDELFRTSTQL